jgi:hypothetical protein
MTRIKRTDKFYNTLLPSSHLQQVRIHFLWYGILDLIVQNNGIVLSHSVTFEPPHPGSAIYRPLAPPDPYNKSHNSQGLNAS